MRTVFWFFMVLLSLNCKAQSRANYWFFSGTGLNFGSLPTTTVSPASLTTTLGCASISNTNGVLQFYTNGTSIWTSTGTLMANGSGIANASGGGAQNSIIIPKPGSSNLYYLFVAASNSASPGLTYCEIDMNLASGSGSVIVKNAILNAAAVEEKISATLHCNGTDYWIVSKLMGTGTFVSYQVTAGGILAAVNSSLAVVANCVSNYGAMKLSPNGTKLGWTSTVPASGNNFNSYVYLATFNPQSGVVSSPTMILSSSQSPGQPRVNGCEFSPDGTKFFVADYNSIWQWDLCAQLPQTDPNVVYAPESTDLFRKGSLQLAPDGKIYVARLGQTALGVINSPNSFGFAANYVANGLSIGTATCGLGLPNFPSCWFEQINPQVNFQATGNVGCNTINFFSSLCPGSGYSITSCNWNFGDPLSGSANTSTVLTPSHVFSASGSYVVQGVLGFSCNKIIAFQTTVTVSNPTVLVTGGSVFCNSASLTANVQGGSGVYSYTWSGVGSNSISATANNLATGNYTVQVKDNGSNCVITNTVSVNSITLTSVQSSTNVLCNGAANGVCSIIPSGGIGPYQYSWTPNTSTNSVASNLTVGVYSCTIIDLGSNCLLTNTISISQPMPLTLSLSPNNFSVCTNSLYQFSVGISGGVSTYISNWNNGTNGFTSNYTFTNVGSNLIQVNVSDANSCNAVLSQTVLVLQSPTLAVNNSFACQGTSLNLSVSGANSYTWLPSNFVGSSIVHVAQSPQTFTIVGNTQICFSSATLQVSILPTPTVNITSNSPVCLNQTVQLNAGPAQSYTWLGVQGTQNQQNINFQTNQVGVNSFSLQFIGVNGCTNIAVSSFSVHPLPAISVLGNSNVCVGSTASFTASGASSYSWNTGQSSNVISISPTQSTTISVVGNDATTGCNASFFVPLQINPLPQVSITSATQICNGNAVVLTASPAGNYLWSNGASSQSIQIQPTQTSVYQVTVTLAATGCKNHANQSIKVSACTSIAETPFDNNVIVFPNPAFDFLMIQAPASFDYELVNSIGQVLYQNNSSSGFTEINLTEFPNDSYILNIRIGAAYVHKKIVKTSY